MARPLARRVLVAVAVVAMLLAVLARYSAVLLRVPYVGWLLWQLANATSAVPMFDYTAWKPEELRTWSRAGDVVVSTHAKAGTNWLLYIAHLIRLRGDARKAPFTDVGISCPWPEFLHYPGQQWSDLKERLDSTVLPDGSAIRDHWDQPSFAYRVFKSHASAFSDEVPCDAALGHVLSPRDTPHLRYIVGVRNGEDTMVSMHHFLPRHTGPYRRLWGGFPPQPPEGDFSMAYTLFTIPGVYVNWIRGWWPYRDDPNVLFVHYSDILRDHRGAVARIAKFLGFPLSAREINKVVDQSSFASMRAMPDNFIYQLWARDDFLSKVGTPDVVSAVEPGTIARRGRDGGGKEELPQALRDKYSAFLDKKLPDQELRTFADAGFGAKAFK